MSKELVREILKGSITSGEQSGPYRKILRTPAAWWKLE
jgi:hypothetical protein